MQLQAGGAVGWAHGGARGAVVIIVILLVEYIFIVRGGWVLPSVVYSIRF